jgi:hypothetical protein
LEKQTLDRWLKYLAGKDAARKEMEYRAELRRQKRMAEQEKLQQKRHRRHRTINTDATNMTVQRFWMMHVEVMNWCGTSNREYAGLCLSPYSLRRWCNYWENAEDGVDWRARLHPFTRLVVNPSTKKSTPESDVTGTPEDETTSRNRPAWRCCRRRNS